MAGYATWSLSVEPTFRVNDLPSDPFGLLARQEGDQPGGILRVSDPPERKLWE
jgi:hypothetical protein